MFSIKSKLAAILELPQEVVFNLPIITQIGTDELNIENYKSLVEFSDVQIRVLTASGMLRIEGKKMLIKKLTNEKMQITGQINKYEYLM